MRNYAPYAYDDDFVFHHSTNSTTGNVIGTDEDWDPDGDPISAILVSGVSTGSLSLNSDGTFTYTRPSPTWTGVTTFTYKLTDGVDESGQALVTIDVRNAAPNRSRTTIA